MILLVSCGGRKGGEDTVPGTTGETLPVTDAATEPETGEEQPVVIETGIKEISKYGNIVLKLLPDTLRDLGFEPADIILVKIGSVEIEMPVGTAYSDVDSGEPVCVFKANTSGDDEVILAINTGNLASYLKVAEIRAVEGGYALDWYEGFGETTTVSLQMAEKQGFAEEYAMHQLGATRTNKRADYQQLSDAEFANFREVRTPGIGAGTLYRSTSPVNPALNRNAEADAASLEALIKTIVNMADSEAVMKAYPGYSDTYYSKCKIIALDMNLDFQADDFKAKLAEGFRFMAANEGPYLLHCNEGKDRTGFGIAVLECLTGATLAEVVADYMVTYYNFYGITADSEQYAKVADSNIKASLARAFGLESLTESADLAACADAYLKAIGMTDAEIAALKTNLAKAYGGLS